MSHEIPIYVTTPPALLTSGQLAALHHLLAGERQSCEDEPATPLGFWPTAVAALLSHADALAMRVDSAVWASEEIENRLRWMEVERRETETAMVKLAGRVKEMQAELSEQEVDKLALVKEIQEWQTGRIRLAVRQVSWGNPDATHLPSL